MGVGLLPRLKKRLQILINTHNHAHKRYIHHDRQRVRSIEAHHAFIPHDILNALGRLQVLAQLHPLLNHIRRCLKEVVCERAGCSNQHCRIQIESVIFELQDFLQLLIKHKLTSMRRYTS